MNRCLKIIFCILAPWLFIANSFASAAPNSQPANQNQTLTTGMNRLLKAQKITACKEELIALGGELFGKKNHKVILNSIKKDAQKRNIINISAVINYNDRNSLLNVTATELEDKSCLTAWVETVVLGATCLEARVEVLKKYNQLGRLDNTTYVYQHSKNQNKKAYTTMINQGAHCLIMLSE